MKISRNISFLLISALFIFAYPTMIYNWSLNDSIGWHTTAGRDLSAFLWPIWFLLIYLLYQRLNAKGKNVKPFFFWLHVAVSALPAFVLNYPFKNWILQYIAGLQDIWSAIFFFNWATLLYVVFQVIFAGLTLIKFRRRNYQ